MRILIDSLIALMLVAVVVCVVMLKHDHKQGERRVEQVQSALDRLHEQAAYHNAVQSAMAGHDTLLVHLHASWFGQDLPTNVLLEDEHAWLDLAPPGDLGVHPPDPVATEPGQAGFWYNPTTGVFRARVVPGASEAETLALYNRVNGTALDAFEQIPDPARKPIAHELGSTPARQYASLANLTWSEPEPPVSEKTERAFAPLIDPQQKNALRDTIKDRLQADTGETVQLTHQPSERDPGDEPAEHDGLDESLADAPTDRPKLDK